MSRILASKVRYRNDLIRLWTLVLLDEISSIFKAIKILKAMVKAHLEDF